MNNWKILTCALVVTGLATTAALADETNTMQSTLQFPNMLTAQQFVTDAAMGGMKEVRVSELAQQKTDNAEVRNLATRMIRDHSRVNEQLANLAAQKGLDLPGTNTFTESDPNWRNPLITGAEPVKDGYMLKTNLALSAYSSLKQLKSLSSREFDEAYAKVMVMDHVNTIIEFEAAARMVPDPELRRFASETLPSLREHSQMARQLSDGLSNQSASTDDKNTKMNTASTGGEMH